VSGGVAQDFDRICQHAFQLSHKLSSANMTNTELQSELSEVKARLVAAGDELGEHRELQVGTCSGLKVSPLLCLACMKWALKWYGLQFAQCLLMTSSHTDAPSSMPQMPLLVVICR
jgi:hypothetical protein